LPQEPPVFAAPVFEPREVRPIRTTAVIRGNVRDFVNLSAFQIAVNSRELTFGVAGERISAIYVSVGDFVYEGDPIASLGVSGIDEELDVLQHRRRQLNQSLQHVIERHNLALSLAETSGVPIDDTIYMNQRNDLSAEISVLDMEIAQLFGDDSMTNLVAPISGVVTQVMTFHEGMISTAGSRVATISDVSEVVYMIRGAETELLSFGDILEMTLEEIPFQMEVIDPVENNVSVRPEWRDAAFLRFIDGDPGFASNVRGNVHMLFDEADDVLLIPNRMIHHATDRSFVFILENNIRVLRDIEIGVVGAVLSEIRAGVNEGDLVIE